jgi:renalase
MHKKVIVVGAGIAGLACARSLVQRGLQVVVLEKSRGVGGRCATRRTERGAFDHGAQYFTARDPRFRTLLAGLVEGGIVAPIEAPIVRLGASARPAALPVETRYAAVPGMSALGRALAAGLDVRQETRVTATSFAAGRWSVQFESETGGGRLDSDALVLAVPSDQALALAQGTVLEADIASRRMTPCWAVMAAFDRPVPFAPAGALIDAACEPALAWIMRDSAKPGRADGERWVLHARADWSAEHLEQTPQAVGDALLSRFRALTGAAQPTFAVAHRWRYAAGGGIADGGGLVDLGSRIAACGDWVNQGRVEGAWISGTATAERLYRGLR